MDDYLLTTLFRIELLSYLQVTIASMDGVEHINPTLGVVVVCKESSIDANNNRVILDVHPLMKRNKKKGEKTHVAIGKLGEDVFKSSDNFNNYPMVMVILCLRFGTILGRHCFINSSMNLLSIVTCPSC